MGRAGNRLPGLLAVLDPGRQEVEPVTRAGQQGAQPVRVCRVETVGVGAVLDRVVAVEGSGAGVVDQLVVDVGVGGCGSSVSRSPWMVIIGLPMAPVREIEATASFTDCGRDA